ncbi:MAG: chemotaxis protein CheX [Deltaproteobacteria bacterium]|nr:chemotaxis protein CheX [Deltaproteobacteria bacterium]
MNAAVSGVLTDVVVETLEKLAFLFAAPLEGPVPDDMSELVIVRVRFSGPLCGAMQLSLSRSVLAELAGNMLGADDGSALSADEQNDALRELINVICGNLLPMIGGDTAEFNIQTPFIPAAGASAAGEFAPVTAVSHLSAESGICLVALQIDGPVPEQGLVVNGRRMDGAAGRVGS